MDKKRDINSIAIVAIVAIAAVAIVMMVNSGGMTGFAAVEKDFQIPNELCYQFAEKRDNMIQNRIESECTIFPSDKENPCTGTTMNAVKYCTKDWHTWRVVFENGDVKGRTGFGTYPYAYAICYSDQGDEKRAEVDTISLGIVHWRGLGYGIWANHPNANYWNYWSIQKCDTIN
ncbi:hypothetical protein KY345_02980 [Candidatus Woesearchaeota archaeon]|nr:hypothetical protein [Candidatus Woesearchaeota archaeon]